MEGTLISAGATVIISPIAMALIAGVSLGASLLRWRQLFGEMRRSTRAERRTDHPLARVRAFFVYVVAQGRLLRWPFAGVLHAFIFWGFVVLLTAIAQGIVEALWQGFRFDQLPGSGAIAFLQDLFFFVVICGIAMALFNRLVINPTRFRGSHRGDAILILSWIAVLLVCMELNYAARIAEGAPEALGQWRPIASAFSSILRPLGSGSEALIVIQSIFFWAHLMLVFGFLVYLGYSKHLHIITAIPNVLLKNERPKGALRTLDIEAVMNAENEADQHFGVGALEHFSWKDMLDLYTCTECGRCQTHCPAYNTGKPLSPKTLITDLRDLAYENLAGGYGAATHDAHVAQASAAGAAPSGAVMWTSGDHHPEALHDVPGHFQPSWLSPDQVAAAVPDGAPRPLIGGTILEETLWSCTTCGACMDQCPVLIEHVPKILDMRRHLVLDESRMPRQAETALRNIENVANPYGLSHQSRADWAKDLGISFAADKPDAEYLYWVGCAASFDDRAKTIAAALARILQAAGVDFAILGTEEKCTGDPARRIGNEYLFQERAKENVAVLKKHNVRKIIASLPPLLQHVRERIQGLRRRVRGRAPHPAHRSPAQGGTHHARRRQDAGGDDHLPRFLLSRALERHLRAAARHPRADSRAARGGDGTQQERGHVLRRRRGPDVDGGGAASRQPPQGRPGGGHARHQGRDRLPLLLEHVRRGDRGEADR